MNDPDDDQGVAASPVNIFDGMRWNTSLGYLDPVRERPNLRIIGDALVDRVEIAQWPGRRGAGDHRRAGGAHSRRADRPCGGRVRVARHPPPLRHRPGG